MAERRAMNKYIPPDYDPKKGSMNTQLGQHHLRDRIKKNGVMVVRFEMPYNVWCLGCNKHIGRGTRYNAHKKLIGKYLSSDIISFKMKCRLCSHSFEIQTDPEHAQFKLADGLKRKEETWDQGGNDASDNIALGGEIDDQSDHDDDNDRQQKRTKNEDNSNIYGINLMGGKVYSDEEKSRLEIDPMFKLQHVNRDKERANQMAPTLSNMLDTMKTRNDNYKMSTMLRKTFREEKKIREAEEEDLKKRGITIPLLPLSEADKEEARQTDFLGSLKRKANQSKQFKIDDLKTSSIFQPNNINNNINNNNTNKKQTTSEEKRKEILKKKSKLDQSLFKQQSKTNSNNNNSIGSIFSSNLFNK
ncbi:coiled-coil domain-containing protein [Cavenderia fasciculata]|uniref:Coiled-coil domain-containing protein n=1 Tax=Cavenderia fasciculata TaxID=261658 RepID=F4Q7J8_CACFS|nr:coiled-coil domain-containing protein [Cavenderia fasciculata]EGG16380.1 coiled-coil domain-containing protein [Cavenderia fasciculata]|eukprot:XP_004354764.1 coiled-coil domain-containing protein [Cavenderia fasciculata]